MGYLQKLIHRNSDRPLMRWVRRELERNLRAAFNQDEFDFRRNGEAHLMDVFANHLVRVSGERPIVIDVGAHTGEWTAELLRRMPDAHVFCFEIVPEIRAELEQRLAGVKNVTVPAVGLAGEGKTIEMVVNRRYLAASTAQPRAGDQRLFGHGEIARVTTGVERADTLLPTYDIPRIDLLKIDVEGMEVDVLEGFEGLLSDPNRAPRCIQFEYGETYLPFHRTLGDIYALLEPHGYVIGRLYPHSVDFKPYEPRDDHFRMGNCVAVKKDDGLVDALRSR